MVYLLVFGLETIAGMLLITATTGVPITDNTRCNFFHRNFGTVADVLSIAFGFFLAYQIEFGDGFFTR